MKKLICLCLALCLGLQAKPNTPTTNKAPTNHQKPSNFTTNIGVGIESYYYEEPGLMNVGGSMLNLNVNTEFRQKMFKFENDFYFATHIGANHYDGGIAYSDNAGNVIGVKKYNTDSTDYYAGIVPKLGVAFFKQEQEVLFVYVGLGYRFLYNQVIDQPGIQASYKRYQGYVFLPIGVSGEIPISANFAFIALAEHRFLLFGHNTTHLTDVGYDKDLFFTQKKGEGGRFALGMKFPFSKGAIKVLAYYDHWEIAKSNVLQAYKNGRPAGEFIEPANFTSAFGLTLSCDF
ncbi:hypothetical protein BBW65_03285 [Helicobacter enhydrae]|uniref:Outer membrane beta-barrel protein n=1 Tax=Helicobacter enhydrae TaxID=222136 RepID=A0A1B1U573_9HELI|nr:hypothetical protein [Helicobacter enhydrae]ANV97881.1 hypothetical protein BBW65_03285 [Helicobacter enhydrae]